MDHNQRYWNHTAQEKDIIRHRGGTPLKQYGYDGVIHGKPVEVRSIMDPQENRYRIMKSTHQTLVRKKGYYIFVFQGRGIKVSAKRVSQILRKKGRKWYKDRDYPHTFIYLRDVF